MGELERVQGDPPVVPGGSAALAGELEHLRREVERLRAISSLDKGLLEAVLLHSPHGILVCDRQGRFLVQNRAAERIWAGSATPQSVADWSRYRAFHPDGRPYAGEDWAMARCLRDGVTVEAEEYRIQRFDGTPGVLLGSCAPILGAGGEIVGALAVFADITELQRLYDAERAARAEAEAGRERSALLLEASTILSSSLEYGDTIPRLAALIVPRMADWCSVELLGDDPDRVEQIAVAHRDPAMLALARSYRQKYPPSPATPGGLFATIRSGEPVLIPELPAERLASVALDDEHAALVSSLVMRSVMIVPMAARGRALGAIVFVAGEGERRYGPSDLELAELIARRAAIAVDNARLYAEAQQAVRVREDVLGVVSHDLRNPLGVISMSASLLHQLDVPGAAGQKVRKSAETIQRNAERMTRLISDLLDLAAIDARGLILTRRRQPLREVAEQALEMFRATADERRLRLGLEIADDLQVYCDTDRVVQVLANLLSNAIKMVAAGGAVTVSGDASGAHPVVCVKDTGPGVAADELPRLFERYWRSKTAKYSGSGLGLAIARGIVEAHGGRIWVESAPGAGASFYFTLPRQA